MIHQQKLRRQYFFLALVPIVLSIILALLPDKSHSLDTKRNNKHLKSAKYTGVSPNQLLLESVNDNRFIQPDELAKAILGQDPSYVLVDLRDSLQYNKFTLPGAYNISVKKILSQDSRALFNSNAYKVVLISNGTLQSDQVWMILRRAGIKNIKVLNGGLNQFYQMYLNPPKPTELDPQEVFDQYSFRRSVGTVLGLPNPDEFIPVSNGSTSNSTPTTNHNTTTKPVTPKATVPKVVTPTKSAGGDEGC